MNRKWIVTFGGSGLLPAIPGTWGSAAAAVVFYLVTLLAGKAATPIFLVLSILVSIVALRLCGWAQDYFQKPDPRRFVLDEVVGQWLTLLFVPLSSQPLAMTVAGFFLFRGCDIAKPFPIRQIEKLPGGWGVLLDDVGAAIYATAALWLLEAIVSGVLV